MSPEQWKRLDELFDEARKLPEDRWDGFARERSGGDGVVAEELLSLLRHERNSGALLEEPLAAVAELIEGAGDPMIGQRVGGYTIVSLIGQGGMGAVYEARQESPRRTVALKLVRPGLMGGSALRRFGQEAEVLGRLEHPGIARIYESGRAQTPIGLQPFFAMELVRGSPLLEHAAARRLNVAERLQLMALVCDAVQHAHQKGVIHRDLKPGNILVDESGQPKILDFGVARLTDSDLRVTTMGTEARQLIGTLPYMSPEQASGAAAGLDTRSDVYALGVLLFELLSGRLPYDLETRSVPDAVRVIAEQDATRLGSVSRVFRGDVETITAKALEKDRERRYQSASDLAADIRRCLRDEPIVARPTSTVYQLSKFARRNRTLVGGVAAAFVLLVAGVIGTSVGLARAIASEHLARGETQRAKMEAAKSAHAVSFLQGMLSSADPESGQPAGLTVRDVLRNAELTVESELADEPEVRASVYFTIGSAYQGILEREAARKYLTKSLELREASGGRTGVGVANCLHSLAVMRFEDGDRDGAIQQVREALALARADPDAPADSVVYHMTDLAVCTQRAGRTDEAAQIAGDAVELARKTVGAKHEATAQALQVQAMISYGQAKYDVAEGQVREAIAIARAKLSDRSPRVATYLLLLGSIMLDRSHEKEAEDLFKESLALREATFGPDHARTALAHERVALAQMRQKKYAESEESSSRALDIKRRRLGENDLETATAKLTLAQALSRTGKLDQAEVMAREALETRRQSLGAEHKLVAQGMEVLGEALYREKKYDEAKPLLEAAVAMRRKLDGPTHPLVSNGLRTLGAMYAQMGDFAAAARSYEQAESVMAVTLADDHALLIGVRMLLGSNLAKAGQNDAAERAYRAALAGRRKRFGDRSNEVAECLDAIAVVVRARGDNAGAESLEAEAKAARP